MYECNASDSDRGASKPLQPKHRTQPKFDRSVILFNVGIQVFPGSNFCPLAGLMLVKEFPRRSMRSLIAVQRDLLRQPTLALERPPENALAAATSRLARSRKSTVLPCLSTAR
jgi:hypothetical protein